jgi:hypothetical protein
MSAFFMANHLKANIILVLHEFRVIIQTMKNVTITMEDHVADWARVEAAKNNTSLSRMLGEFVAEKMLRDDAYSRAYEEWKADSVKWRSEPGAYPSREEIYAERFQRFR